MTDLLTPLAPAPIQVSAVQIQSVLAEYLNLISATSYLSPPEKTLIQNLNLPEKLDFLQDLANIINGVLADGIVDSRDIPQIVLGTVNLIQKHTLANINIVHILKFILTSLLNKNIIPIPPNQLEKANIILENSFTLLEITIPSSKSSCFCCF